MLERIRNPENRLYISAIIGLLALGAILGCLFLYEVFIVPQQTSPLPGLAPKALSPNAVENTDLTPTVLAPTLTAPVFIASETATLQVSKKIKKSPTAGVETSAGQSCNYSSAALNNTLPPVPSGSWSPIEHYVCNNGYWEIGTRDVIDKKTGDWGQDGVPEKILIKYDSSGNIVERIFLDPDGNQISGPKN